MTPLPIDPAVLRSITPAPVAPVARPQRSRGRSDDEREQQQQGRRERAGHEPAASSPVDDDGHVDVRA